MCMKINNVPFDADALSQVKKKTSVWVSRVGIIVFVKWRWCNFHRKFTCEWQFTTPIHTIMIIVIIINHGWMESVHGNQKVISYSLFIWTYQNVKTGWCLGNKLMVTQSVHSHLPLFNLVLIMDFIHPLGNRPHTSHNFLFWNFASCACVLLNRKYK